MVDLEKLEDFEFVKDKLVLTTTEDGNNDEELILESVIPGGVNVVVGIKLEGYVLVPSQGIMKAWNVDTETVLAFAKVNTENITKFSNDEFIDSVSSSCFGKPLQHIIIECKSSSCSEAAVLNTVAQDKLAKYFNNETFIVTRLNKFTWMALKPPANRAKDFLKASRIAQGFHKDSEEHSYVYNGFELELFAE